MKEIQKPDLKENKIIVGKAMKEDVTDQDLVVDWYDSNMYDGSEIPEDIWELSADPRKIMPKAECNREIKDGKMVCNECRSPDPCYCYNEKCPKCEGISSRLITKKNNIRDVKHCKCLRSSQIYSVYSPNRCYCEYVIKYSVMK